MADRLPSTLDAIIGELPSGAAAIGVVRSAKLPHWAAEQAVNLANAAGSRGGRALLLNLESAPSHLDRLVGGMASRGLSAVLRGEASPSDAALTGTGRDFIYFPAGAGSTDPAALASLPALGRLIHQMMTRGAIVLLYTPEEAVTSEVSDVVDAWVLLGCEAPEQATAAPVLGRVRGPRKDVPGPDEAVNMATGRTETLRGGPAPLAVLSGHRNRSRAPRRPGSRRPDTLPALLFVYLLVAAFAITLWFLDPSAPSGAPEEPDVAVEYLELTDPVDSAAATVPAVAAADSLSELARPYSSLTGSGAQWIGMDETLRKLDSLFNDSTPTARYRR